MAFSVLFRHSRASEVVQDNAVFAAILLHQLVSKESTN